MTTTMTAMYDGERVPVTPEMQDALVAYMRAMCAMMRAHEPELADRWTWGRCEIRDLAHSDGLRFWYGGENGRPDDGLGDFGVVVATPTPNTEG